MRECGERPRLGAGLLVLGMHRSGTSVTSGILWHLGVDLGHDLMEAAPANEKGFFENTAIVALHDRLLARMGRAWDDPRPWGDEWRNEALIVAYKERLKARILREFGRSPIWAVKDPRLCRLLPLWKRLFCELRITGRAILVLRDPREVAASLQARDGMETDVALRLWLRHVLEAERGTRGLARVFVTYEEMITDWRRATDRIARTLEVSFYENRRSEIALDAFVSPALRHHRGGGDASLEASPLTDLARSAYEILLRGRKDGEPDGRALEALEAALNVLTADDDRTPVRTSCERP